MSKPKKYDGYHLPEGEDLVKCEQEGYEHRWICPVCKEEGHVQLPAREAHDCKMVSPDGRSQCMCYSKEHGLRRDD